LALCHSPLFQTKDKFCKSCIQQHWTAQHNFHIWEITCTTNVLSTILYSKQSNIKQTTQGVPSHTATC
jgi:hypothetical protein